MSYVGSLLPVGNAINQTDNNLTLQRTVGTITSGQEVKPVSYISFDATVGRNSRFYGLSSNQASELLGIEYRVLSTIYLFRKLILYINHQALCALTWIVSIYAIAFDLFFFTILAAYTNRTKFQPTFQATGSPNPSFFSIFQVVSAWSNTGFSLVDTSLIPFTQDGCVLLMTMIAVLVGTPIYPILLRATIWTLSKCVTKHSKRHETLLFILDHPRRCYFYLFPTYQTYLLALIIFFLWALYFLVFNLFGIGNNQVEAIPVGYVR